VNGLNAFTEGNSLRQVERYAMCGELRLLLQKNRSALLHNRSHGTEQHRFAAGILNISLIQRINALRQAGIKFQHNAVLIRLRI